jgi:hypothetical protein
LFLIKFIEKLDVLLSAPTICEPGVADAWGFSLIGTVNAIGVTNPNYTFTDNSNLIQGIDYSYIVVAVFADGSSSLAPAIVCVKLVRDVPLVTNVSVDTTDASVGKVFVRWIKPLVKNSSVNGLDTIANPGPYEFRLLQGIGVTGVPTVVVYSATQTYFAQLINLSDTTFTSLPI